MDTITYLNYEAFLSYDDEAACFYGRVINTRDVISFRGKSVEELHTNMQESIDGYIDFCREEGREPEKPYSGKFNVRIDPDLHRLLAVAAAKKDVSLNSLIAETLEGYVQHETVEVA